MSPSLASCVAASKFLDEEVLQIDVDGDRRSSPGAYFPTLPGEGKPLRYIGATRSPPVPTAGEHLRELREQVEALRPILGTAPTP